MVLELYDLRLFIFVEQRVVECTLSHDFLGPRCWFEGHLLSLVPRLGIFFVGTERVQKILVRGLLRHGVALDCRLLLRNKILLRNRLR